MFGFGTSQAEVDLIYDIKCLLEEILQELKGSDDYTKEE